MKAVVIIGSSAVGKMTVAQEVAKRTGFILFHNHMAIEPVLEIFGYYNMKAVNDIRDAVFNSVSSGRYDGIVTTLMCNFDSDADKGYIEHIIKILEKHNIVDPCIVELTADTETRRKRNESDNRLKNKPSKRDLENSRRLFERYEHTGRYESLPGEVPYEHYIKIDNTHLEPYTVADAICETFQLY